MIDKTIPTTTSMARIEYLHYIPLDKAPEWEAAGWIIKDLGPPHNAYSVLGVWPHPFEPPIP